MAGKTVQRWRREAWVLARRQHGVIARRQLLELGAPRTAIEHRLARGRLHRLWRGVYAVGRPEVSQRGRWMAAVLACGPNARLSHRSAACLWGVYPTAPSTIDVVVPASVARSRSGVRVYRQLELPGRRLAKVERIPVTDLVSTLIDLASVVGGGTLERSINEADRKGLINPEDLAVSVAALSPRPGLSLLRGLLERESRSLTDSGLERRFRRIARAAGLPAPETQVMVNGYRVDFLWPKQGLVVEVDGLRYHRTPLQQAADRRRDQTHTAAGLTVLRFAQHQVVHEPEQVESLLRAVAQREPAPR